MKTLFGFRGIAVSEPTIYIRWIFLPVIAHWLSWLTGMGGIVLFPFLLTFAQMLILQVYSETVKPVWWLCTLPITLIWWYFSGPARCLTATYVENTFIRSIALYYVVQAINAFFLLLVVRENPWPAINRWFGSVLISGACWFILYFVLVQFVSLDVMLANRNLSIGIFVAFPLISLASNALGGLYLIRVRERAHVW